MDHETPLPGRFLRNELYGLKGSRHLVLVNPDRLEVRLGVGRRLVMGLVCLVDSLVALAIPAAWGLTAIPGQLNESWTLVLLIVALTLLAASFLLAGVWVVFDLGRVRIDMLDGEMTWPRLFGLRAAISLESVRSVQLVYGGFNPGRAGPKETFQVNLIVDDHRRPRRNLLEEGDLERVRRAGGQLAEFLGVPLRDQLRRPEPSA